jgi:hypothetical protein
MWQKKYLHTQKLLEILLLATIPILVSSCWFFAPPIHDPPSTPVATPVVKVTSPATDSTPTWTWTVSKDTTEVSYQLDGTSGTWTSASSSVAGYTPDTALSDGTHILYVRAKGKAEWSEAAASAVVIDTTAPEAPVVIAAASDDGRRPVWSWNTPEGTVKFRIQIDNELESDWTEIGIEPTQYQPAEALSLDSHALYVQAGDETGNWSASGSDAINLDPRAPEFSQMSGLTNNSQPTWSWTAPLEAVSFECQLDATNGTWIPKMLEETTFTPPEALPDGPHTLWVRAVTRNGVRTTASQCTIVIDTIPPDSPVVSSIGSTGNPRPEWNWTVPADAVELRYQLDGETAGLWTPITPEASQHFQPAGELSYGAHTFYVQAVDQAGNWSTSGSFQTIVCPSVPVISGNELTNGNTPTWTWTVGAGTTELQCQVDGTTGSWISLSPTMTSYTASPLSDGVHTFYLKAIANGGESPVVQFATFIDTKAPTAPIVSGVSPTAEKRPVWTWSVPVDPAPGSGIDMFKYQLDKESGQWTEIGSGTTQYQLPLDLLSPRTLYVQARDRAGNWSVSGSFRISPIWSLETVDATTSSIGQGASVAVNDLTGNPLISYTDFVTHRLWLASWNGTAWQKRLVYSSVNSRTALALDIGDTSRHPHILVTRQDELAFSYLKDEGGGSFTYYPVFIKTSPYNILSLSTTWDPASGSDMAHILFACANGAISLYKYEMYPDSSSGGYNLKILSYTPANLTGEHGPSLGYNQANAIDQLVTLTGTALRSRIYRPSTGWQTAEDIASITSGAGGRTAIPQKLITFSGTMIPQAWVAYTSDAKDVLLVKRSATKWESPITIHQHQSSADEITALSIDFHNNPVDPSKNRAVMAYIVGTTLYCAISDGFTSLEEIVDTGVTETASIAVSPSGQIHIAYYDSVAGSLTHAARSLP